jgi:hypothetical protein
MNSTKGITGRLLGPTRATNSIPFEIHPEDYMGVFGALVNPFLLPLTQRWAVAELRD